MWNLAAANGMIQCHQLPRVYLRSRKLNDTMLVTEVSRTLLLGFDFSRDIIPVYFKSWESTR
jgi:hypothetical protein